MNPSSLRLGVRLDLGLTGEDKVSSSSSALSGPWPIRHSASKTSFLSRLARKNPCCRESTLYLQVWTLSTNASDSLGFRCLIPACTSPSGATSLHCGSECIAGYAKWYVNLYFFKSAKHTAENAQSSEGQENMLPSLIASHIVRPTRSTCLALSCCRNSSMVLKLRIEPSER